MKGWAFAVTVMLAVQTLGCQRTRLARVTAGSVTWDSTVVGQIRVDLTWPGATRTAARQDALWLFAKFRVDGGPWQHARLLTRESAYRIADTGGVPLAFETTDDGMGVFLLPTGEGTRDVRWSGIELPWNHSALELTRQSSVDVEVIVIPMVSIPTGPFVVGDGDVTNLAGHFRTGGRGAPFAITGPDTLVLGRDSVAALSNSNAVGMSGPSGERPPTLVPDDFNDASRVLLPPTYPTGFQAFYIMQDELTQGIYARFLAHLTPAQAATRNPGAESAPARPGLGRYAIATAWPFLSAVPDRPVNYVSWMDAAAFADWAGLRPLTELEFEKAARGPQLPEPGQFAWGTTRIAEGRYSLTNEDTPAEVVAGIGIGVGNAAYRGTVGNPVAGCASCIRGPLPATAFLHDTLSAEENGASYYGVRALSGNLFERVVTVGHPLGRAYRATHGDGRLNERGNAAGQEVTTWPGSTRSGDSYEVTGALGTGLRGGSWASPAVRLRVADRAFAATADTLRLPTYGIRLGRTARAAFTDQVTPPSP